MSDPDETLVRVHKALSHLKISKGKFVVSFHISYVPIKRDVSCDAFEFRVANANL